jgi:hypothetical protein
MRIKGHDNSSALVLGGVLLSGSDDFLMAEMQPIKNPNGQGHRTRNGSEGLK